ncbi:hypothetical protein H4S14_001879 [Agrobacterium vitis]|nr:hypothetical protein [Agrobacterium vitis]MBE1438134.1 hypothetical protein [Agrobacterium vitis]
MRVVIVAGFIMAASGLWSASAAQSASIETIVTESRATPSIVTLTCTTCPPLSETRKAAVDVPPKLAVGTQKIQVRTVNGKKQLVRTEAWLGGSPVVFINKQGGWLDNGSQLVGMSSDGVDSATETGAVSDVPHSVEGPTSLTPDSNPKTERHTALHP